MDGSLGEYEVVIRTFWCWANVNAKIARKNAVKNVRSMSKDYDYKDIIYCRGHLLYLGQKHAIFNLYLTLMKI
jgi:hypothetical protein